MARSTDNPRTAVLCAKCNKVSNARWLKNTCCQSIGKQHTATSAWTKAAPTPLGCEDLPMYIAKLFGQTANHPHHTQRAYAIQQQGCITLC
jgi:hypothetical protein